MPARFLQLSYIRLWTLRVLPGDLVSTEPLRHRTTAARFQMTELFQQEGVVMEHIF
ncbi:hypothetical protein [Salibacterium lacus]|uniref:Uncharacterized protein n=1 Tax=Salibacterium lacus TaxID=1898109 RepID=A0ABW5T2F5_9BACI